MTTASFNAADLVALRRVGALAVHPSGTWAAVVVERLDADGSRYVSDLWRLELAGAAAPRRLTRGEWKDRAPAFDADGTLYFLSDRPAGAGGATGAGQKSDDDKRAQVWALPDGGGEPVAVTDEPHGVAELRVRAGRLVVLSSWLPGVAAAEQRETRARQKKHGPSIQTYRAMPVRYWDAWLGPTEPRLVAFTLAGEPGPARERRDLTDGVDAATDLATALREPSWDLSPDGTTLAITWAVMNPIDRIDDRPIALIDTSSGARRVIGAASGAVHSGLRFAPDGRRLAATRYLRTRDGYGARTLWLYDVAAGDGDAPSRGSASLSGARELTAAWDRWPTAHGWSADGSRIVVTAENEGALPLFAVVVDGPDAGRRDRLGPARGAWDQVCMVPGTRALVGVRSSLLAPPEPVMMDDAFAPLAAPRSLGSLSGASPDASPLPTVRELRVGVADRQVPVFVVEPVARDGADAATPTRTLLWIHGGPVSAWADQWHWRWSALLMASRGYRVVLPNPAGSTGYGIDWVNGIWGNVWGERCYDDLMGVVDALVADGIAASDMVVMGGSFGGYMTNWIGGHSDRFRLLVSHASVFQMSTFHLATDAPPWWELMMGGTMWSDAAFDRCSPSRFVPAWKTPTLVLHGEKDYRVPVTESLMLYEALQRHGVPSGLAIFPDENHWILRPKNVIAWYDTVLGFIDRMWSQRAEARPT
ncbi:MAG: S9 family peptidase [Myxococcota bacterium]